MPQEPPATRPSACASKPQDLHVSSRSRGMREYTQVSWDLALKKNSLDLHRKMKRRVRRGSRRGRTPIRGILLVNIVVILLLLSYFWKVLLLIILIFSQKSKIIKTIKMNKLYKLMNGYICSYPVVWDFGSPRHCRNSADALF